MIKQSIIILIMGVSGSGKSTIGKLLADSLEWDFSDADAFHSPENIEKMRRGIPLSEADRIPWLQGLQTAIKHWLEENKNVVLACSALKDSYRQFLLLDSDGFSVRHCTSLPEAALLYQRLRQRHTSTALPRLRSAQVSTRGSLTTPAAKFSDNANANAKGERIKLVYLKGSYELIQMRLQERSNHYMSQKLLNSQFDTLEEPKDAISIDVGQLPQIIVQNIRTALGI